MPKNSFAPVIGLEVHVELQTESKMFCGCPASNFGKKPNTQTCPVCLGLPGALPVPNERAIAWTQMLGAALECNLTSETWFERKHYFYPDLPKGYQISQYERPLATNGQWLMVNGQTIRIRRVHLEEDTGKLLHKQSLTSYQSSTLIDFNRSGVPLVEIVTEPDFSSSGKAVEFVKGLQQVVRYLKISDADMEKGSMRLEANISLKVKSAHSKSRVQLKVQSLPDYRVELKNINSFRFMQAAIEYEIKRQAEILEKGERITQETRGYDERRRITKPQRWKEFAQDYRYFPEPDIPPFSFNTKELEKIKEGIPELPQEKRERFRKEHGLPEQYVHILAQTRDMADYFEEAVRVGKGRGVTSKRIADAIVNKKPDIEKILPAKLVQMLLEAVGKPVLSNEELEKAVVQAIKENPDAAADYKKGKHTAIQFLVGQVMRRTKGQADPQKTKEMIEEKLK